ncbi:MAG: SDR family oxidoreductase [Planctomycetes bacterium]|nr:SDR family oxidoreductase [Planctomycetota bacterium]
MRTVVTGGAGFIGSNLVRRLLEDGHSVAVIDDLSTGRRENIREIAADVDFQEGDIRDDGLLERVFTGAEVIFHQAAIPSVPRSVADPSTSHDVIATGTLKVLKAAATAGVARVVYASSSSVYGDAPTLPKVETMTPQPLSPYAVAKLAGENYCRIFPALYGLETVSLRYFNVFGPRQDPASQYSAAVPIFITRILTGRTVHIDGDGGQSRDFTFVDNVVQANILAATADGASGEVFNVGVGTAYTVMDLFKTICKITGTDAPCENGPPRPGDVRDSLADISKARRLLGYDPHFDFGAGLEKTVEFFSRA